MLKMSTSGKNISVDDDDFARLKKEFGTDSATEIVRKLIEFYFKHKGDKIEKNK